MYSFYDVVAGGIAPIICMCTTAILAVKLVCTRLVIQTWIQEKTGFLPFAFIYAITMTIVALTVPEAHATWLRLSSVSWAMVLITWFTDNTMKWRSVVELPKSSSCNILPGGVGWYDYAVVVDNDNTYNVTMVTIQSVNDELAAVLECGEGDCLKVLDVKAALQEYRELPLYAEIAGELKRVQVMRAKPWRPNTLKALYEKWQLWFIV